MTIIPRIKTKNQRFCNGLLAVIDSFLSVIIFAPLVVGYWRGCWQLTEHYLLPNDTERSLWTSFAIGTVPGLFFCLAQVALEKLFDFGKRPTLHLIASRIYTIGYCVISVNHWRGVWAAWDFYTGISWISGLTSALLGIFFLSITRGLVNILAPPFIVVTDHPDGYFSVQTQFGTKVR